MPSKIAGGLHIWADGDGPVHMQGTTMGSRLTVARGEVLEVIRALFVVAELPGRSVMVGSPSDPSMLCFSPCPPDQPCECRGSVPAPDQPPFIRDHPTPPFSPLPAGPGTHHEGWAVVEDEAPAADLAPLRAALEQLREMTPVNSGGRSTDPDGFTWRARSAVAGVLAAAEACGLLRDPEPVDPLALAEAALASVLADADTSSGVKAEARGALAAIRAGQARG